MPEDRSILDRPAPQPTRAWAFGESPDQVADLYLPPPGADSSTPPVVLLHGGYWRPEYDRRHLRPMAAALAAAGHPTALVEYARVPGRPDAALADVHRALVALPGVLGPGPPLLLGHSAGGQLALVAAAGMPATGVLALAPVADLAMADRLGLDEGAVRSFLGGPAADRPDLDPAALPPLATRVTLLHGDRDSLVPLALSESYCADGRGRLVVLPGIGHFEPIDPQSPAWAAVLHELSALAAPSGIE